MADAIKVYEGQTVAAEATILTVPPAKAVIVTDMRICNTGDLSTLVITAGRVDTVIKPSAEFGAGEVYRDFNLHLVLEEGAALKVAGGEGAAFSYYVSGMEIDVPVS